jgi:nucleoid-associated protein YgaU
MPTSATSNVISANGGSSGTSGVLEKMFIVAFKATEESQKQTFTTEGKSTTKDVKVLVPGETTGTFTVMFNPSTITVNSSNQFDPGKEAVAGDVNKKFKYRSPRTLSVELFFDGTYASPTASSAAPGGVSSKTSEANVNSAITNQSGSSQNKPVANLIHEFFTTCVDINSETHAPPFVKLSWGKILFSGVIESANVTYSLFDNHGSPLRAKVSLSLKEHFSGEETSAGLKLQSPDLTKFRTVILGDTLYSIATSEYGNPYYYIKLAEANNLKNFRVLKPGSQLVIPPIEKINVSK